MRSGHDTFVAGPVKEWITMPEPKVFDEDTSSWTHGAAIANAGATYTAAEQEIINNILAALRSAGIIAQD
ncbi:MAG TPA: hypothetical protein DEQ61_13225 [Streptomyces sp.]|nr:hypothetical protein [Streptomyces sp.]